MNEVFIIISLLLSAANGYKGVRNVKIENAIGASFNMFGSGFALAVGLAIFVYEIIQ